MCFCFHVTKEKCKRPTYIAVLEQLVHVDAFRVEERLFLSSLRGDFTKQAARQAFGFHDDGVLSQC